MEFGHRHAKDALGEMKFLRRRRGQSVEATAPLDRLNAVNASGGGGRSGGSGLTSLSAAVTDNHRLPAPVGRRLAGRRSQYAADNDSQLTRDTIETERAEIENGGEKVSEMRLTAAAASSEHRVKQDDNETVTAADELDWKTNRFNLSSSDHCPSASTHSHASTRQLHSIPRLLHQTSDDVTVPTQVRPTLQGGAYLDGPCAPLRLPPSPTAGLRHRGALRA